MQSAKTIFEAPQPVSFEIEVERRGEVAPPAVKQRLEERERTPLTLQMIQDKLERAYERKAQAMMDQVEQARDNIGRVSLIVERKNSMERAQGQRIIEEIDQKQSTAEAKRKEQLTEIQERARTHNNRVLLIRERRNSKEKAEEERF